MEPLGIYDVSYSPGADPVLFYPLDPTKTEQNQAGTDYGDGTLIPGADGPFLSTHELTIFVDAVLKEVLLTAASVQQIRDRALGFEDFGTLADGTRCYGKEGYFPPDANGGSEIKAGLVHCDNEVSGMVVVNGSANAWGLLREALQAGF
jgi:hypothetical protein